MKKVSSVLKDAVRLDVEAPSAGATVSPTSGAKVSPTSGATVSPTSGATVAPTSGAMVSPTSGATVSPTCQTKTSPTRGAMVSPTSRVMVSPTSGANASPTSQGHSGMEPRRPNFQDKGLNVIHKAAREGNRQLLKQILFFGISDLNSRDKKCRTPLHVACAYGRSRIVRLLIERQCLLDLRDSEKKTALIKALQYQNVKCAAILLDYSADPNAMDNDGNTALHYAVLGHNKAIVEKLLACKTNTEVRNKSDLTPLALAKLANNDEMVELLESRAAKDDQRKRKQPLIYEYKEERRPETFQSSNLATNLQESPKSPQTETKSKTVDEISAEGSLNSKQQLTSEYQERRRSHTSESTHRVINLRHIQKQARTETKSNTVDESSEKDSLSRLSRKSGIDDAWPTSHNEDFKVEEKKKQKSSKREVSGNMDDGADKDSGSIGLSQQSNKEHTDNPEQPSDKINENTVIFMNKVEEKKEQKSSKKEVSGNMDEGADDSGSGGLSQQNNSEQTDKQQVSIMENEESHRFTLEEEKEKKQKVDLLYEKNRVQLRKKEEHSIKEVEMNPCLQTTIRTRDIVSKIARENKVSESSDEEKSGLHENRMLWDAIAKLRREMNTVKNQVQEMGKNCLEEIAIVQEKTDRLEKAIRKTVFQHNVELEVLRVENTVLNSKLEDEQQNRRRLEAEVESYRSRLATAEQDHEHCQTSKGDLQLTFQRASYEWFCLCDKMNSDMSNLKHKNEVLSQQLSKRESKSNNLEFELHHTRDALKERTLVLERGLVQKQCQKEETEHMCQKEQGKVDKDIGKPESLQEKLSHLRSEMMLLRQQLDQAHNKADREEKTAMNIQHQIQDKISIFNAECVKQIHMLNERINELINEWQHFKERIHQYENDHVERHVSESSNKEESLLHENCMLWDENAKLRLEIDTAKNQVQEMGKNCFEEIAIIQEKTDHLEKTIRETVFQHNEQLEVWRAENTVLNSKLEDEQQKRGRLEAEVELSRSGLATAEQDHERCQTSKGDLQLTFQRARDEWFCTGRSFYIPVESQHLKEDLKKYIESNIFLQQRWQQAANTKNDLEKEKTRLKELLKVAKKKLHECDNEELSFPGDSKPSPADMEIQSKKPKQKNDELTAKLQPSSSTCIRLGEEKSPLQQLAMEALLKECEELENTAKKWEQENLNLRTHMERNMVESCVAEEYKKNIEERTRRDVADKYKQINSFLQTLRGSEEISEQRINNQDAIRSSLELRNKELKSQLSRVQDSLDDRKRELEKYVQLYQKQVKGRKLLENQLTEYGRSMEKP